MLSFLPSSRTQWTRTLLKRDESAHSKEMSEYLFSYGTLQDEAVQLATFGRRLDGRPDILVRYKVTMIPIRDQEVTIATGESHYRNIEFTGNEADVVKGTVFKVSQKELDLADQYESSAEYERVSVELNPGTTAWVYLYPPS